MSRAAVRGDGACAAPDVAGLLFLSGCCGVDCGGCRSYQRGVCMGCKGGYATGERNINRTRCGIKRCCFRDRRLETCASCGESAGCGLLAAKTGGAAARP